MPPARVHPCNRVQLTNHVTNKPWQRNGAAEQRGDEDEQQYTPAEIAADGQDESRAIRGVGEESEQGVRISALPPCPEVTGAAGDTAEEDQADEDRRHEDDQDSSSDDEPDDQDADDDDTDSEEEFGSVQFATAVVEELQALG